MKNKIITISLAIILVISIGVTTFLRNNQRDVLLDGDKIETTLNDSSIKEEIKENLEDNKISLDDIAGIIEEDNENEESNLGFIEILDDDIRDTKTKIIGKNENVKYEIKDNVINVFSGKFDEYEFEISNVNFDTETYVLTVTLNMYALNFNSELIIKNTNFAAFYFEEKLETTQKERKYNITSDLCQIELKYQVNQDLNIDEIQTDGFSLNYKDELNIKTINIY